MTSHPWLSLFLIAVIIPLALAADEPAKGDRRAAALMQEASANRYTWSPDVIAVSGKFTWKKDAQTAEGTFRVELRKFHGQKIDTTNPDVRKELQSHLRSLVDHRTPPVAGVSAPPPSVIVVEDEERGPLIMPLDDPLYSTHRVKDGRIVQVNRKMAGRRFTIDTRAYEKSIDGRFFPTAFTVTWWEATTGKRVEKRTYTTTGFHVVDGQMFPKLETIVSEQDGKTTSVEITYSDIKFERK